MSPATEIPYRHALIIANPIAGTGRARARAQELRDALVSVDLRVDLFFTSQRGDAPQAVRDRHADTDVVLVVGGDGTVAEVLSALPKDLPIALFPMGTANVMGVDLGIPRKVSGTLAMLASGRSTGLDIALVNGRISFVVVGLGPDGYAVRVVDEHREGPINKLHYVRGIWHTLLKWRPTAIRVELDGKALPGSFAWVLVSNVIGYGGLLRLSRERRLDDGLWEVYLFPRGGRLALLSYALRGILLGLPGGDCRMQTAGHVRLSTEEPAPMEIDGDYAGQVSEVTIEVQPDSFLLLLP
ncbi:MAG: diacylglycerol kinase (ATP) [Planctomycetota bacterium]